MKAFTDKSKIIETIDGHVGGESCPTLFASSSRRRQHLPTPPATTAGSIGSSYFGCARSDLRIMDRSQRGLHTPLYEPNDSARVGEGRSVDCGRVLSQSLLVARERRRRELGSNLVIVTTSVTAGEGHVVEFGISRRVRKICAGVPASVVIRDQILTLSFSRSQRQYWTVGNRPIRKNDLRSLHRNSVEAQIQDRSRNKTGLNTAPGFSRVNPSFPRTREPREKQSTPFSSPSRSEGDACAARRGCTKTNIMPDQNLAYRSATDLLDLIKSRQVSPVELTELFLKRIDDVDHQLDAFLLVTHDIAIEQAKTAEDAIMRGDDLGPLHGLPIPIKDNQMTAGIRTTSGSIIFKDHVPLNNAAFLDRILQAGGIILGKTNCSELGFVGTCENSLGITGKNPWDTTRTPGGSSGGAAAAVAAHLAPIATGGDGGGSLRIPSNFCGTYAIKPTLGRVSGYSGIPGPPAPNFFGQPGPIARSVKDAAVLLQTMAGFDRRDPISIRSTPPDFIAATTCPVDGLRIAWSPDFGFADVDPDVARITHQAALAFQDLGCTVDEIDITLLEPYDSFGIIQSATAYNSNAKYLPQYGDQMTEYARFTIEKGSQVKSADYAAALGRINELKAIFDDVFATYDLILAPVARFPAFINEPFPGSITGTSSYPEQFWNGAFTMHANATGSPAASVPAGFTPQGLPVGLQIIGRKYDEETVLAASAAFEQNHPWIHNHPPTL